MDHLIDGDVGQRSARNLVEVAMVVHAMFMAAENRPQRRRTIFMGC
jgi:hypothetical protein